MNPATQTRGGLGQFLIGVILLPYYLVMFFFVALPFLLLSLLTELMITCTKNGNVNFYPKEVFPWVPVMESNWRTIRSELDAILENLRDLPNIQDISPQGNLTQDDKWKSYLFNVAGEMDERNCRECPQTAKLLSEIPDLYFAQFSILTGKKHIKAHRGHYKGVVNCHLALIVPDPPSDCRIRVTNEYQSWEEGKILIFDDRKEHEAWNDSDSIRVVLIMHVIRPLPFPLSKLNRLLLAITQRYNPVVRMVRRQNKEWFQRVDSQRPQKTSTVA